MRIVGYRPCRCDDPDCTAEDVTFCGVPAWLIACTVIAASAVALIGYSLVTPH